MRNLCDAAYMSYEVAALPFQAHANNVTWSIYFGYKLCLKNMHNIGLYWFR